MVSTTDSNACLVGYRFVPVEASTQESYRAENLAPGSVWADPKIDQAATWMQTLAGDPELRRRIGARAARDIARRRSSSSPEALLAALGAWRTLHPELGAAAPSLCGPAIVPPTL